MTSLGFQKIRIYYDTISKLKLKMILYRIYLRGLRKLIAIIPFHLVQNLFLISENKIRKSEHFKGLKGFIPIYSTYYCSISNLETKELLANGYISAINECASIIFENDPTKDNWDQSERSLLYQFNLHYFEWVWELESNFSNKDAIQLFNRFFNSWILRNTQFEKVKWAPYVVSLRLVVLLDIFNRWNFQEAEANLIHKQILLSYNFLKIAKEYDVEGNHLIKNLKALILAECYLDRRRSLIHHLEELHSTFRHQILKDGAHYERSMSYHVQVLTDIIDIHSALVSYNSNHQHIIEHIVWLDKSIHIMNRWLNENLDPSQSIWAVNDSFPISPKLLSIIANYCRENIAIPNETDINDNLNSILSERRKLLQPDNSGYFIYKATNIKNKSELSVLFDIGDPCPQELPAHCHADSLNLLFYYLQYPILYDTGVSTYEAGIRRNYERSTRAHNTLTVDNQNSTAVWGAFRAGRRAKVTVTDYQDLEEKIIIAASHDGFRILNGSPLHHRQLYIYKNTNKFEIFDSVLGSGDHQLQWYFHFPLIYKITNQANLRKIQDDILHFEYSFPQHSIPGSAKQSNQVTISFDLSVKSDTTFDFEYILDDAYLNKMATDFGKLEDAACLRLSYDGSIPVNSKFTFDNFRHEVK